MHASQLGPRRCVLLVFVHAVQIEVAGKLPLGRSVRQLIGAQVVLVRRRAGRHVAPQLLLLPGAEGHRQRVDDASGQLVLQLENVLPRELRPL